MAVDFEREVIKIAATVPEPEMVSSDAIAIAVQSLHSIDERYGVDSDNPLAYHNAYHSLDVCRRGVRLAILLHPYIPPKYSGDIYNLAIMNGPTHDWRQDLGPHHNEIASADYAAEQARGASDPRINSEAFGLRLHEGIMATEVERTERGEIVQVNLQKGSHDPHKFIAAFSDINGIAMEGRKRMIRDAVNLCYEIYKDPTLEQLWNFIIDQPTFLRQRLNDGRIKADIAYYFPSDIDAVYGIMRKAFHANIISAHGLGLVLGQRPELKAPIGVAARTMDSSLLGKVVSQQIKRSIVKP